MKIIKRMIAAVASLLMLAAALPAYAAAPSALPSFSAPVLSARPGESVVVPVYLTGDYAAHGLQVWLVFENDALILESFDRGEVMMNAQSSGGLVILDSKVDGGKNTVRLGIGMPTEPFSAEGVLFYAKLTVSSAVEAGRALALDVLVKEFFFMPIGEHTGKPISHSVTNGRINVTDASAPTAAPTSAPTSAPTTAPTTAPTAAPTSRPSQTPGNSATPRPTPAATSTPRPTPAATSTPRPTPGGGTPTPRPTPAATPTARPTPGGGTAAPRTSDAPATPDNGSRASSPDPNATPDPYARFSASPFPGEPSPTPDGSATPDPYARFSASPAPTDQSAADASLAPFDTVPPSAHYEPQGPSGGSGTGALVAVGVSALAVLAAGGFLFYAVKRRRKDGE